MRNRSFLMLGLVASLTAGAAQAHVVFTQPEARAGSHWAGALRVGHGCDGSATTSVRVEIPAGIVVARPQPKAGWTVTVERQPLTTPIIGEGGAQLTERVSAITWTGRLPDEHFEEFALAARLPAETGTLQFPVIQTCEQGENRWTDIPQAGAPRPSHPAAMLTLHPTQAAHH